MTGVRLHSSPHTLGLNSNPSKRQVMPPRVKRQVTPPRVERRPLSAILVPHFGSKAPEFNEKLREF